MKTGFLYSIRGNPSSPRLFGGIIIAVALIISCCIAYWSRRNVMQAAEAIAIQFPAMTSAVIFWMFKNKQTEIKHEESKQETLLLTDKTQTNE